MPPAGSVVNPNSAVGQAMKPRTDIPTGDDRGSKTPIASTPPGPAHFTSNGSLPHGFVGSPSGPVPGSSVGLTAEQARTNTLEALRAHAQRFVQVALTDGQLAAMSRAEIVAIATQRGYLMPQAGTRVTRTAFLEAQTKDPHFTPASKP